MLCSISRYVLESPSLYALLSAVVNLELDLCLEKEEPIWQGRNRR